MLSYINVQTKDEDVQMNKRNHQLNIIMEYSEDEDHSNKHSDSAEYSEDEDHSNKESESATVNEYEEKIKLTGAERIEFLKSFKIAKVKSGLKETVNKIRRGGKKPSIKKTYKQVPWSLRMLELPVSYSDKYVFKKMMPGVVVPNKKVKAGVKETVNKIRRVEKKPWSKKTYEQVPRSLQMLNNPVNNSAESDLEQMMPKAVVPDKKVKVGLKETVNKISSWGNRPWSKRLTEKKIPRERDVEYNIKLPKMPPPRKALKRSAKIRVPDAGQITIEL